MGIGVIKNYNKAFMYFMSLALENNKFAQKLLETIKDKKNLDYILIGINAKYQTPLISSPKNEGLNEIIKNIEKCKIQL